MPKIVVALILNQIVPMPALLSSESQRDSINQPRVGPSRTGKEPMGKTPYITHETFRVIIAA